MAGILNIRRGISGITLTDGEFYLNKGINAVQIGSGSAILTLLPINKLISGDIILNGNVYANNLTGSGALAYEITANLTVGGIDSGTTFPVGTPHDDIFRQLLTRYQAASLSNLVLYLGGSSIPTAARDVGNGFSFNRFGFSAAADSQGNLPVSASFVISGTDSDDVTFNYFSTPINTSNLTILTPTIQPNRSIVGNMTFTVNAKKADGSTSITPLTLTISYRLRNYLAASATDITTNANAQSVINSDVVTSSLLTSKAWTATCSSANDDVTKWTYIIYPASYGDLSGIVQTGPQNVFDAFVKLSGTFSITINGITNSYIIYKSTQYGAYSPGVQLTTT
jgi:hypothetical protein